MTECVFGPLHGSYFNLDGSAILKIIIYNYFYTIYCCLLTLNTIGTSRQSQLACHIRVDLQYTGKARIASPDGARGPRGRGALIVDAHVIETEKARKGLGNLLSLTACRCRVA